MEQSHPRNEVSQRSHLRKRRPVEARFLKSSKFISNGKPHKKDRSSRKAEAKFVRLSICQILIGAFYASILSSVFYYEALLPYREVASWFLEPQHLTSLGMAHVGPRDVCLVATAFITVIAGRALLQLILYSLLKFSRRDLSIKTKIRFTEQTWCLLYYGSAALWGLRLLKKQPYGWDASTLWVGFPHYYIDPGVKQYYLSLLAYWFTQVLIIHIEDRRKDHFQMLTHHFVTCALVVGSYAYSYTRIGHLVLIMMDTVDVFLSLAKCSKYLGLPGNITDTIFILFLISWVLLRHFVYMYEMIYAVVIAFSSLEGQCIYDSLNLRPIQCFSAKVHYTFFALAMSLQAITMIWLVMIVKIVLRVVKGDGAADSRSDSEDD